MPEDHASIADQRRSLIDGAAAARAVAHCAPLLESLAHDSSVNQSGVVHVVVVDATGDRMRGFDAAVLHERNFGRERADWDADYAGFARAKARLSWEHRCDSHALHTLAPQRLRTGDSALWGSVHLDGIVVAVSGCEAPFDEAASAAVATMLRACCKQALSHHAGTTIEAR